MKMTLLILSMLTTAAFAQTGMKATAKPKDAVSFMPENRAHLQDNVRRLASMTEADFNRIIDAITAVYAPVVKAHGAELVVEKNWSDSTVNAFASQSGKTWKVAMFGGLARRPEVTQDGFAMVVCHELGHHLGGYVFKGTSWASAEGQSDYFATQICARTIWGFQNQMNLAWKARGRVADTAKVACDAAWPNDNARGWCYRASSAGHSLATLLANLGSEKPVSFETPDPTVVTRTNMNHPNGQCRLDTYFQGALCTKTFDLRTIPGKTGSTGTSNLEAEMASAKLTCFKEDGAAVGARPACWFRSLRAK